MNESFSLFESFSIPQEGFWIIQRFVLQTDFLKMLWIGRSFYKMACDWLAVVLPVKILVIPLMIFEFLWFSDNLKPKKRQTPLDVCPSSKSAFEVLALLVGDMYNSIICNKMNTIHIELVLCFWQIWQREFSRTAVGYLHTGLNVIQFTVVSQHGSKVGWYIIVRKFIPDFHALHIKDVLNFQ